MVWHAFFINFGVLTSAREHFMTNTAILPRLKVGLSVVFLLGLSVRCEPATPVERIHQFDDCSQLESFLKERYLDPQNRTVASSGAGVLWGCASDTMISAPEASMDQASGAERSATNTEMSDSVTDFGGDENGSSGVDSTPRDFTSTNTQEKDVDEPDMVKNDGDHIYVIRDGQLIILDAWPAEDTSILSSSPLPGRPRSMFLTNNTLVVIATSQVDLVTDEQTSDDVWEWGWQPTIATATEISWIDISDKSNPFFVHTKKSIGDYLSARRVNDEILLATQSSLNWPRQGIQRNGLFQHDEKMAALADHTIQDMLPATTATSYHSEDSPEAVLNGTHLGVTKSVQAARCENIYASDKSDADTITFFQVYSVDEPAKDTKSTGIVSGWTHLYSSTDNAYMVVTERHDGGYYTPSYNVSKVHQFSTFQGDGAVEYVASGIFDGDVHNQFSMSERDGLFRVVVTENPGTAGNSWGGWNSGEGNLTSLMVMEKEGADLLEVARVENIGNDEVVQSVRFIGDRAYVVTYPFGSAWNFRRNTQGPIIDPLFVIDLEDPRNPKLRGELKVPGYSTYIHPLGTDHLLTVGVNSDEDNMYQGMSISIFDVKDPDTPSLAHRLDFGSEGSDSDALSDHHAFTFFAAQGILGIPIHTTEQGWPEFDGVELTESSLRLFKIDVDSDEGIRELGALSQMGLWEDDPMVAENTWLRTCYPVRRSVMISDDEGVFAYALSHMGATVGRITEDNVETVTSLSFGQVAHEWCNTEGGL